MRPYKVLPLQVRVDLSNKTVMLWKSAFRMLGGYQGSPPLYYSMHQSHKTVPRSQHSLLYRRPAVTNAASLPSSWYWCQNKKKSTIQLVINETTEVTRMKLNTMSYCLKDSSSYFWILSFSFSWTGALHQG